MINYHDLHNYVIEVSLNPLQCSILFLLSMWVEKIDEIPYEVLQVKTF